MYELHPDATASASPKPGEPPRLRLVREGNAAARRSGYTRRVAAGRANGADGRESAAGAMSHESGAVLRRDDPRWVVAVMTAEALEGALLAPEKRQRILRIARGWGLSPFDANLIIAVVQDQARRGAPPHARAAAAEPMLRTISAARGDEPRSSAGPLQQKLRLAWIIVGLLGFELALLALLLG